MKKKILNRLKNFHLSLFLGITDAEDIIKFLSAWNVLLQ